MVGVDLLGEVVDHGERVLEVLPEAHRALGVVDCGPADLPVGPLWQGTVLELPPAAFATRYRDALCGHPVAAEGWLALEQVLATIGRSVEFGAAVAAAQKIYARQVHDASVGAGART